jgi:hypothetical protein
MTAYKVVRCNFKYFGLQVRACLFVCISVCVCVRASCSCVRARVDACAGRGGGGVSVSMRGQSATPCRRAAAQHVDLVPPSDCRCSQQPRVTVLTTSGRPVKGAPPTLEHSLNT